MEVSIYVCRNCGHEKPKNDFYLDKRTGNPRSYCKPCQKLLSKEYGKNNKDDPRYRATKLISYAKQRGKDCDLDQEWVAEKIILGSCEITGLPFDLRASNDNYARPFAPSLDRTDSRKGYTKDNVKVVCWIYNRAKGAGSHEDVMSMVEALWKKS